MKGMTNAQMGMSSAESREDNWEVLEETSLSQETLNKLKVGSKIYVEYRANSSSRQSWVLFQVTVVIDANIDSLCIKGTAYGYYNKHVTTTSGAKYYERGHAVCGEVDGVTTSNVNLNICCALSDGFDEVYVLSDTSKAYICY